MKDIVEKIVRNYVDEHLDKSDSPVKYDVFIVWKAYILGNWKALASTTLPDGMYYEITYDVNKDCCYLDAYKKFENQEISLDDIPEDDIEEMFSKPEYSKLIQELTEYGALDSDVYGEFVGKAVLELVKTIDDQQHSGFTYNLVSKIFSNYTKSGTIYDTPAIKK